MSDELIWQETLPGCATWSHVLKRGTSLRLTALSEQPNVSALFYNADQLTERLNLPDTLKAQHIARLTAGNVLYSDMGRVLCSITHDMVGWHDPLGGCSDAALVAEKYGELSYQTARNGWHQNALDSFLIELAKYGMGLRDLAMNVNFFSKVTVDTTGAMSFVAGHAVQGSSVELRAEMNTLVILCACAHPMDLSREYVQKDVGLELRRVAAPGIDDACRTACAENERGFLLTERYFL